LPTTFSVDRHTYTGWFIGTGYEYALGFFPGLFWKTEYRFSDYGTDRVALLAGARDTGDSFDQRKCVQTVRSELVWRFNWGGRYWTTSMRKNLGACQAYESISSAGKRPGQLPLFVNIEGIIRSPVWIGVRAPIAERPQIGELLGASVVIATIQSLMVTRHEPLQRA
jgi:hypothetical protein